MTVLRFIACRMIPAQRMVCHVDADPGRKRLV
jgi:hypothetical protein